MKKATSEQANVQTVPQFENLSPFMTFHLLQGIAWTEAFPKAKAFADKHERTYKDATLRNAYWRGHANWLIKPEHRHSFDLTFEDNGQRGQVVHKSGHPLGQEEIRKLIEETHVRRRVPSHGKTRNPPGTAPVKYEPKDYKIGDGRGYVYAYYYPGYRKNEGIDFPIKIGRSIEYQARIETQSRATGMPEEPEVAIVWRTDKPEAAEKLLHELLKFRGKHLADAPGTEWFQTSPDEIRQVIESIQPGVSIRNVLTAEKTWI